MTGGWLMSKRHVSTDRPSCRRHGLLLAPLLCLLLALGVSACGTKPPVKASGDTPQRGGTFVVTNGEPPTLDPAID